MKAYVLHENDEWMPPLRSALEERGIPYDEWFVDGGQIDITSPPPVGVYLNRMSASAHTRGHEMAVPFTRQLLGWLDRYDRPVINGARAFELEVSKVRQYAALRRAGVRVPRTRAVTGTWESLLAAAEDVPFPLVVKPNRGGKGIGVRRFRTRAQFAEAVESGRLVPSPDGITLLQQYIESAETTITRCEFVGGEFLYAIRANTSEGFELCPAEPCRNDGGDVDGLFSLREDVPPEIIGQYTRFLEREGIDVAGIEFVEDPDGWLWTYDVNVTTNYSPDVEQRHGVSGMGAVAELVNRRLKAATDTS